MQKASSESHPNPSRPEFYRRGEFRVASGDVLVEVAKLLHVRIRITLDHNPTAVKIDNKVTPVGFDFDDWRNNLWIALPASSSGQITIHQN